MKRLTIILILGMLSTFALEAQQIFKWKMTVREVPIDGVAYQYDTIQVLWGIHQDSICFNFDTKLVCFFDVKKGNRYLRVDSARVYINHYVDQLIQANPTSKSNKHAVYIKQDRYNELYLIRFLYSDTGVWIVATNIVFGVPAYDFHYHAKCNSCIPK